jgi:thiamine kinase-like enzyme
MTIHADTAAIRDIVDRLALFPGASRDALSMRRMGGQTNRVYRVAVDGKALCLRLPGKGTEEYIDRRVEGIAAAATARAGVSPEVVHFDPATGVMVTRFVADAVTMSPALFATRPGAAERAGRAFRTLHDSGAQFDFRFELFAMIDTYLGVLATREVAFPDGYHRGLRDAEAVRAALGAHPVPLVPCHCDPLAENFLDTGDRMWIVDWEYSGMNDPMWDLGDLAVEANLSAEDEAAMLAAYFGREASAFDRGRMVIYKAMCDLLWTLWGLIQLANENPAEDFAAYARDRFARCRTLMESDRFGSHLDAARRGPTRDPAGG